MPRKKKISQPRQLLLQTTPKYAHYAAKQLARLRPFPTAVLGIANVISETESGGEDMKTRHNLYLGVAAVAIALAFGAAPTPN